jgi:hypothetical protein
MAEAHRLIEPPRTSPAANSPGILVSMRNDPRERSWQRSPSSTERSSASPSGRSCVRRDRRPLRANRCWPPPPSGRLHPALRSPSGQGSRTTANGDGAPPPCAVDPKVGQYENQRDLPSDPNELSAIPSWKWLVEDKAGIGELLARMVFGCQ